MLEPQSSSEPNTFITRLVEWSIRQRVVVLVLVLGLIGAGTWALKTLRVDAFPDLTDAQVQVLIEAPGLCCGEDVMLVLSGEGIGFLPAEVGNVVCTFSAALGRGGFDDDGEAGRLGFEAE